MKKLTILFPYIAVLIGLYLIKSAWAAIGIYHAGIIFCIVMGRRHAECSPGDMLKGWNWKAGLPVGLACACAGPLLVMLWPMIARGNRFPFPSGNLSDFLEPIGLKGAAWYIFIAYFAIVHPILEEKFWRGTHFSESRFITPGDLAFAGYHFLALRLFLEIGWAAGIPVLLTAVSWMWRRITLRYGGLAIPVISHGIAGISVMAAAYYLAKL